MNKKQKVCICDEVYDGLGIILDNRCFIHKNINYKRAGLTYKRKLQKMSVTSMQASPNPERRLGDG